MSTDVPEITGDSKIVVTFEDIIRCAQAAILAGSEKKAEAAHGSLEHSEGDGHKHGAAGRGSHEDHDHTGPMQEEQKAGHSAEKEAPTESPLTYIILPSLGLKKPC